MTAALPACSLLVTGRVAMVYIIGGGGGEAELGEQGSAGFLSRPARAPGAVRRVPARGPAESWSVFGWPRTAVPGRRAGGLGERSRCPAGSLRAGERRQRPHPPRRLCALARGWGGGGEGLNVLGAAAPSRQGNRALSPPVTFSSRLFFLCYFSVPKAKNEASASRSLTS